MKNKPSPATQETIAARAYQLWEEAGRPDGRAEEFWQCAEQQQQTKTTPPVIASVPPPLPASPAPAHVVPPVIRETVQPVARPASPAPARKRRAR